MKTSKLFGLDKKDFLKGFVVAVITAVVATSGQMIEEWMVSQTFHIDKISITLAIKAAIGAGVSYLFKNYFTGSRIVEKADEKPSDIGNVNYVIWFAFLIMLSSCVATKNQKARFLAKHCERKDSISYVSKDSIVYRDSLVQLPPIVADPIYLENPCKWLCDSFGNLKPFNHTYNSNGIKSSISTIGNVLIFNNQVDSLKAKISWLEKHRIVKDYSHTENTVQLPCELEHRTKFDGFTWWWFWITAGMLTLWILIKLAKTYLKAYLPFLR